MNAFSRIYYFFISIIMSICLMFDIPMKAIGPPVDLTGYEIVWQDEFEGTELDTSKWRGHNEVLGGGPSQFYEDGYYSDRCIEVKDGSLILSIRYFDGSEEGYPEGWYFASIDSFPGFFGTYGYYEIRAKLAKAVAGNCAFYLQNGATMDETKPASEGAEIDIMESMRYGVEHQGSVENNVHYYDSTGHQRLHARWVVVDDDIYDAFHTYGVKWDKTGYTFYVDGKECRNTDFGLSQSPEYIVLENFMRDFKTQSIEGDSADFVVDYVRVYQQK